MILKLTIDPIRNLVTIETEKGIFEWKYLPASEEGLTAEMERLIEMIRPGTLKFLNFSKQDPQKEISPG